ncbi:hypothetical protein D770_15040 [Flammeovirgaceae bacterium 311]|nr:hypothetical protein D770_15040 [Flammeovirgaceae bacterium 311]
MLIDHRKEQQQIDKLREIFRAVSKHCHLKPNPTILFQTDRNKEDGEYIARMFIVGFAHLHSIRKRHIVSMLCVEDCEYYSLWDKFEKYVLQPVDVSGQFNVSARPSTYLQGVNCGIALC